MEELTDYPLEPKDHVDGLQYHKLTFVPRVDVKSEQKVRQVQSTSTVQEI